MALEETVFRYCAYTRIRDREGRIRVLPADISVAMFQHGTSRENDPQLHTHCVIFNVARTHEDGKWRAMHQYPVYSWAKAAGAVNRHALAWNLRERLGIRMEQYGLVDDWERHERAQPGTSTVVLARTKAEGRALSWLMRERVLARTPDAKRAVIEVSRDLDGRLTEPLEIAVGDRIRIGATQWEKQLFNGTVVTVEDLEVRPAEAEAVSRKARNRQAGARTAEPDSGAPEPEYSVHITARTDDGRRVTFRHDEIRDWHDNIRLDYGYAMTIASAQGLTVDRAFLLVDERPARETIYPAATRHREALDIYVNRAPLALDIAEHRPEDEAERPVLDSDVRAYLAERWSRSQPKEAALDYVSDGAWRDVREDARERRRRASSPTQEEADNVEAHAAANDNALVRIAQEIRHAVNGWRHGAAVEAFAADRNEVLAAWDELRERARDEGEALALSPAFRETLDRHGALMRQARMFRARPQVFERLLAERAGVGLHELAELGDVYSRAGRHLRSVKAKVSHAARHDTPHEVPGIVEAIATETAEPAAETAPEPLAPSRSAEEIAAGPDRDTASDWRTLYKELQRDWNDLVARSEDARAGEPDLPLLLMDGYDALIHRVHTLADRPDLSDHARNVLGELLEYHDDETVARETAEAYLEAAERHVEAYKILERQAGELGIPVVRLDAWPQWREAAEMLAATGKAVLSNEDKYGAYLDAMTIGKSRAQLTVEQLRNRLRENRTRVRKRSTQQTGPDPTPRQEQGFAHILEERHKSEMRPSRTDKGEQQGFANTLDRTPANPPDPSERQKGFAHILDDPEKLRELREKVEQRDRRLGRHIHRSRGLSM